MRSLAISMIGVEASPVPRFWISAICMAGAGILAPGAVIGIAAFPLLAISLIYGLRAFSLLPAGSQRPQPAHFLLFALGLLIAEAGSILHGAIAFAWTHPETHAAPPHLAVTLLLGFLPVALCIHAVERRLERGWALAVFLLLGFILVNPAVLFFGRMLHLPASRAW